MMVRKDIPPERMTKKGSPKWKKQRGFPETVARKATDEDIDGSRALLRVLARSHVAKGGSLPFWLKCNAPFMPQAAEPQELAMPLALEPLASPMPLDL